MVVPTQKNHKSTSTESVGVPVLFSIKNVQPLILAAKPNAESISRLDSDSVNVASVTPSLTTTGVVGATTSSVVNSTVELKPKARRSGLLSKAIATGFVVMLILVVIRFSVPSPKQSADVADSAAGTQSETIETVVTGPELQFNADTAPGSVGTRVASRPVAPEFNLGTVEIKSSAPASEVPILPPLLSESKPRDAVTNNPATSGVVSPQRPIISLGAPASDSLTTNTESSKLESSEQPSTAPMLDLTQYDGTSGITEVKPSFSTVSDHKSSGSAENLHVLDTLTPERSLAEFEWLFRNATKNPLVPYRPVSAGSHDSSTGQTEEPGNVTGPVSMYGSSPNASQTPVTDGPSAYQPLTIPKTEAVPAYERNIPGQVVNRYQQRIKQPQKNSSSETINMDPSTTPAPYQPLIIPDAPQSGVNGTNYGYPPVQYSPVTKTATENNSSQSIPGQR